MFRPGFIVFGGIGILVYGNFVRDPDGFHGDDPTEPDDEHHHQREYGRGQYAGRGHDGRLDDRGPRRGKQLVG
ncbi:MAG: hypothetical protein AAGF11_40940 [Myxococcota bacterium]